VAEFLKESVLEALRKAGRPLKSRDLAKALAVDEAHYRAFRAFVDELTKAGDLYAVRGGGFAPPDRINLVVGHLTFIRSGAAFLLPEKPGEDIYVPAEELADAYHGDKVVVRVETHRRGRPEGRVVKVLERASTLFVGTVKRAKHFVTVSPDDPRFRRDVFVPVMESMEALDGQKVMVEITDWGSPTAGPTGRVSEVLGTPGDLGLDVLLIVKHNGLPTEFPPQVTAAAATLPDEVPAEEIKRRVDLRGIQVVTIDPVSAKDFDDALSLTVREDGDLELGVHIADVSHYVRFDDTIDREAWQRGTSVYLVDRVLPMLPEKLSNHLCSLNPNVDRLAMSVLIHITERGRIMDYRIEDTVIRSTRRLAYEEAQAFFDGDPEMRRRLEPVAGLMDRLRALAAVLNQKRVKRGALDFDLPESRVILDAEGFPIDIRKVVRMESHRLVEEFMLLANEVVARHLLRSKRPSIYRVHEEPAEKKLEELQTLIGRFGYSLHVDANGKVPPSELQRVLKLAEGKPEEQIVHTKTLRSLARARYDTVPLGHFGLALKDYTHFTSPIRRYPDLLVHRALRVLSGRQPAPIGHVERYREWLEDAALRSSERERLAERAERDSIELKKIQFMERHLGEEFDGVITGVEVFGFFVELGEFFVSGLVHISALGDDYYEYWENDLALVGSNTGRRFTLGDRVRVQVLSVSKELRQIDFLLVGGEEPREPSPEQRHRRAKTAFEGKAKPVKPRSRIEELKQRSKGGRRAAPTPGRGTKAAEGRGVPAAPGPGRSRAAKKAAAASGSKASSGGSRRRGKKRGGR
jgi:ribonuclease R